MKIATKLLLGICALFLALIILFFGYYFIVTSGEKLRPEKLNFSARNVILYDENCQPVDTYSSSDGILTAPIDTIPKKTQLAFIDTEDKRFFSHNGFDFKRIIKATFANLKSGSFKQGASTISQQLIKNTHLTHEKTLSRKLKEWKLTRALEKKYSKAEILEKYLNSIYFGHNCFGIASASDFYFGKKTQELDIADSAILAGLLKSPNNYSPFKNPDNCKKRKESVLDLMLKNGSITKEEKALASQKPLPSPNQKANVKGNYAHFVFDELSEIAEKHEFQYVGDIEIYTYLNLDLQNYLTDLLKNHDSSDVYTGILNAKNKGFSACYSTVSNVKRLPASLIKPLLVYAPAIEADIISPATPILDEKVNFGGYTPENYDKTYHGYTSARECLAKSLNIPAVKILQSVGVEKGVEYLKKMRLSVDNEELSLALALGGMKNGFTMKDLITAYSTLQNQGVFNDAGFIKEIKIDGTTVYQRQTENKQVFSQETAYLTTDMLKTTAKTGTAKKLQSLPFEIAAKTGTTGTSKGNTDAYALSYTTKDVVGVWLGNSDNSYISQTGGNLPCNYLYKINEYLYKNNSPPTFVKPSGVVEVELDKASYLDKHTILLSDSNSPKEYRFVEVFKKSNAPTKTSDLFTNPTINSPILQFNDNTVKIIFDGTSPQFYEYTIDKYDFTKHTIVYSGKYVKEFIDRDIRENKKYIYTITPSYNGRRGQAVVLPTISTKKGENIVDDREILQKPWWDY